MAIAACTIWEVQNGGDDTNNGGGFDPSNANMATDLAATSGTTASPVVTSASYNFVAGDVGHWLFIKSGTNWIAGWYQIASVASNAATLTATAGTGYLVRNNNPYAVTTADGCATTGSPTSGTWSIDYSINGASRYTFTDMVIDGTLNQKFTSAANPVGKNFVGNIISVTSGTGFTVQRVQISSVTGTTGNCDKSLGTLSSTGGNGKLGGALATPGKAGGLKVAGNDVFIKYNATAYDVSSTSSNVAGGVVADSTGGLDQTNMSHWVGYDTHRHVKNTDANKPTLQLSATPGGAVTIFGFSSAYQRARNLIVDANSKATTTCLNVASGTGYGNELLLCGALNFTTAGFAGGVDPYTLIDRCYATGGTSAGTAAFNSSSRHFGCEAYANACTGFGLQGTFIHCIASGQTNSKDGFSAQNFGGSTYINCTSYGNGGSGFNVGSSTSLGTKFINCLSYGNTSYGFAAASVHDGIYGIGCAAGGNGTADVNTANLPYVAVTALTGDPFTNSGSGDFSLDSTTGEGAACRAAGILGAFPRGTSTGYLDIGAVQHQDSGGGGSGISRSRLMMAG